MQLGFHVQVLYYVHLQNSLFLFFCKCTKNDQRHQKFKTKARYENSTVKLVFKSYLCKKLLNELYFSQNWHFLCFRRSKHNSHRVKRSFLLKKPILQFPNYDKLESPKMNHPTTYVFWLHNNGKKTQTQYIPYIPYQNGPYTYVIIVT